MHDNLVAFKKREEEQEAESPIVGTPIDDPTAVPITAELRSTPEQGAFVESLADLMHSRPPRDEREAAAHALAAKALTTFRGMFMVANSTDMREERRRAARGSIRDFAQDLQSHYIEAMAAKVVIEHHERAPSILERTKAMLTRWKAAGELWWRTL